MPQARAGCIVGEQLVLEIADAATETNARESSASSNDTLDHLWKLFSASELICRLQICAHRA